MKFNVRVSVIREGESQGHLEPQEPSEHSFEASGTIPDSVPTEEIDNLMDLIRPMVEFVVRRG